MAQIPVTKVRFFINRDASEELVATLHEAGTAELIKEKPDEGLTVDEQTDFHHRHQSARLDSAVDFLSQYHKDKDPLRAMFEGTRVTASEKDIATLLSSHDTDAVLDEVHRLQTRLIEINAELKSLEDEERTVKAWERLNFSLSSIADSESTALFPLHGSTRELDLIEEKLKDRKEAHLERVGENALLVVVHRNIKDMVDDALRESEAEVLHLPHKNETAAEALVHIIENEKMRAGEKAEREKAAAELAARELANLKQLSDRARWSATERDTAATISRSESVSVFDVWISAPSWKELEPRLSEKFSAIAFDILPVGEKEIPPTVIENRGLVRPYEFITRLYGVPSHKDLDPTPFLSIFFFIFFGLSLSDFGYGFVLMALTGAALVRYKVQPGMRSLLTTLFFGGLGAAIAGVVYGGYFGVSAASLSPLLARLQAFDPIGNPMPVFFLALIMGVVQVMFGIILDIVRTAKNNDVVNGLLDNVPWLLMFLILITYATAETGVLPEAASVAVLNTWGMLAIAAAVLISVSKARLGKGIVDKALKGVLALYGGVNYFSDILSYSRLLALGLATSALGFSINLIAQIVGGESLGIGTIFAILVLLAGHTLNITLSTLGAFIHSSRLQYVEFFGKFLTGTGRPFTPFKREEKNIILIPDTPG